VSDTDKTAGKDEKLWGNPDQKLNWRQSKFVAEYTDHGNCTKAAEAAGYSHPSQQGSRLLNHVGVIKAITAYTRHIQAKTVDKHDWLMAQLEKEAGDAENSDASRVRSLELIGKIIGAFAPEKQQVETVNSGFFADLEPEASLPDNVSPIKSGT
jgi:phage terminase small subunit